MSFLLADKKKDNSNNNHGKFFFIKKRKMIGRGVRRYVSVILKSVCVWGGAEERKKNEMF